MTTATETKTTMTSCPIENLREAAYNPRRHFDEKQLADLVESVKSKGILNPLLVRPISNTKSLDPVYEIVGGARRFRAAKVANLGRIPCIVRELTDQEALEVAVIDNLQRADVHPLDEAEGYAALLDHQDGKYDVAAIAAKVGKSASFVYQRVKLAELIAPAKKAFSEDRITAGHAILIARLTKDDQETALDRCLPKVDTSGLDPSDWNYEARNEPVLLPVRNLAQWIADELHQDLAKMPFDQSDVTLLPKAGPCTTCPKRTGNAPELFADVSKEKDIQALSEKDTFKLVRGIFLSHWNSIDEGLVLAACKRWKVDVDAIKKQFQAQWDAEDGGKKFTEPTCGRCNCTEENACEGGCSWVLLDKATNCGICSACATPADWKKAKEVEGKKAAKKKTKK
jgi:ParB/RepB/Spo0J family partition protein